jgi:hypothetical protein
VDSFVAECLALPIDFSSALFCLVTGLPSTLPYTTVDMTCTFSLQLRTVMHTHTSIGLRLKTPMRSPAEEEEDYLYLGFVLILRPWQVY